MIVTNKPFLPDQSKYFSLIKDVWKRNWLTNNGPLVHELESEIKNVLNVDNVSYVTNGTIALQLAIRALDLKGEIITTPFSFIATTSSIVWEGCSPVFADISKTSFNILPESIESKITPKTVAILATHVYGNPCEIDAIEVIAKKHKLKVIYDGAHAFGVNYKQKSIFEYGDISITSFHATKLFHTIEGGAVFCSDREMSKKIDSMKNFGFAGPEKFKELGLNGKNSEFHAAMGLCNLPHVDEIIQQRKNLYERYKRKLSSDIFCFQEIQSDTNYNYSYFPLLFPNESLLNGCIKELEANEIFSRRYFYPLLSDADYLVPQKGLENAENISQRIICLPLYFDLTIAEVDLVCEVINKFIILDSK